MKKWYRIYEIKDATVKLEMDNLSNWYDTLEAAENMVEYWIEKDGGIYTIVTVYEKDNK